MGAARTLDQRGKEKLESLGGFDIIDYERSQVMRSNRVNVERARARRKARAAARSRANAQKKAEKTEKEKRKEVTSSNLGVMRQDSEEPLITGIIGDYAGTVTVSVCPGTNKPGTITRGKSSKRSLEPLLLGKAGKQKEEKATGLGVGQNEHKQHLPEHHRKVNNSSA